MKRLVTVLAVILLAGCASGQTASVTSSETENKQKASSGKTVTFGKWQNEKIDWYVLDKKDGKTLLLSVHALDTRPFSERAATWDSSSLRAWLNDEFYHTAFTASEQQDIANTSLENGDDLKYGTAVGKNTEDHVFLLSGSEAEKYLSGNETVTSPTEYALSKGAYTNEKGDCAWWLRSPGMNDNGPAYYSSQGDIGTRAHQGSETIIGVRPAVWIVTDALSR